MTALVQWLKEIIVVILLAAFVDLILPNHSMQRYVKVVISLFIVMLLLRPVISLLKEDMDMQRVEQAVGWFSGTGNAESFGPAPANEVETILQRGEKLNEEQSKQAKELLEQRIETAVADSVNRMVPDCVDEVKVTTEVDKEGHPELTEIDVRLNAASLLKRERGQEEGSEKKPDIDPVKPVQEVKPVLIDSESSSPVKAGKKKDQDQQSIPDETKNQIISQLSKDWQLAPDRIRLTAA